MTANVGGTGALVLAGARATGDPLCEGEGVSSKAIIDIDGAPMLSHVVRALNGAGFEQPVWVLGGEKSDIHEASSGADIRPLSSTGDGPASSLANALESGVGTPLLVTTADHPLLTSEIVEAFLDAAKRMDADICIGFARRDTIESVYPNTKRTYLPIGAKDLSGCNLFYLSNEGARAVLNYWGTVEKHRKNPWKIARKMSVGFLLQLLMHRSDAERVFSLLSNRLGATIKPVILPFADAAIDVDNAGDLALVRDIFAKRRSAARELN